MSPPLTAFIAGLTLGFSLIIVIGAQNAFVLKQGLLRRYVGVVVLICTASDALLIAAGVAGFYLLLAQAPWLEAAARIGGAVFLFAYGARSFYTAWRSSRTLTAADDNADGLAAVTLTCLALTWLNPHVYLDTLVLLGSVSTQYAGAKVAFAAGATLASCLVFVTIGYGARLLSPVFARPVSWKILDAVIGVLMWTIAATLIA